MSDGIKLNQGVVTSLANTDLVVAADNGGSLRPISFANLMQLIRDNIQVGGRNLLKNTAGNHTNIEVSATDYGWWTPTVKLKEGVVYTMSFECDDDLTGGVLNLRESDKNHFDPTLKKGANNRYYGTMAWKSGDLFGGFTLGLWLENKTLRNIKLEQGNIPTDWSPAPEDSWGGVKRCATNSCELQQKGGQRNDRGDRTYQYTPQRDNDRCSLRPGVLRRLRHLYDKRVLRLLLPKDAQLSSGLIPLRHPHGQGFRVVYFAGVPLAPHYIHRGLGELHLHPHVPHNHRLGTVVKSDIGTRGIASRKEVVAA